jgi:hypothetical protein
MIETRIARRYLWASRKQKHTAFLSLISMLGLAVGVATLLISLALLSGLQNQIKERLIASSPQILIEPKGSNAIADAGAMTAAGRRLGMKTVKQIISGFAYGQNARGRGRPMRVRSYEAGDEPERIGRPWVSIDPNEPQIFLTRDFAAGKPHPIAFAAPEQDLDQPQEAPADQQKWPVQRDRLENRRFGMQIPPQEQGADDQEYDRPGK